MIYTLEMKDKHVFHHVLIINFKPLCFKLTCLCSLVIMVSLHGSQKKTEREEEALLLAELIKQRKPVIKGKFRAVINVITSPTGNS